MKIGKAVKWMFLGTVCHLNAQNNFSAEFAINTQPTTNIKINESSFGVDYNNFRTDLDYGARVGDGLYFHAGGFYRTGEGVRETGFNANNGHNDFSGNPRFLLNLQQVILILRPKCLPSLQSYRFDKALAIGGPILFKATRWG